MKRSFQMICIFLLIGWSLPSQAYEIDQTIYQISRFRLSGWSQAQSEFSSLVSTQHTHLANLSLKCKTCNFSGQRHSDIETRFGSDGDLQTNLAQSLENMAEYPYKPPQPQKPWRKPLGWTLVGVGGAAIVTGFIFHMVAWDLSADPVSPSEKPKVDEQIDDYTLAAVIFYGSGALVAASGIALLLWEEYVPFTPQLMVTPKQASLSIRGVF